MDQRSSSSRPFSPPDFARLPQRQERSPQMPSRAASEAPRSSRHPAEAQPKPPSSRAGSEDAQYASTQARAPPEPQPEMAQYPSHAEDWMSNRASTPSISRRPAGGDRMSANGDRDSFHDTARTRLNERTRFDPRVYSHPQRPPKYGGASEARNNNYWEPSRVTVYRNPQSPVSSRHSNNSMRTAGPARSRTRGPSRSNSRRSRVSGGGGGGGGGGPGNRLKAAAAAAGAGPLLAKIEQKTGGLEQIVTPLRLGLLLGCFDMIGGSLSAWMTWKRFGAAAQAAETAKQAEAAAAQAEAGSGRRHHRRRGEGAPQYDEDSETDSEYDERRRRVAQHVSEQQRMDRSRSRR
ncbi:Hypothetical predicted protein [Lecanosticta acicola]|uniref:Uncharacterized protein n=1 Tax=Lecanosticta acicola TaxID=111012 RepID=A0AAI9EES5_9PEZI|nr:Hypothetical predicted protein [Lecanosticta acicola]